MTVQNFGHLCLGALYLCTVKEERKWAELNHLYMSEESEASDADVINTHRLTWHSESKL